MHVENILGISEFKEVILSHLDFTSDFYEDNWEIIDSLISGVYNYYYTNQAPCIRTISDIILLTMGAFLNEYYE